MFRRHHRISLTLLVFLVLVAIVFYLAQASSFAQESTPVASSNAALISQLNQQTEGSVRISYHSETGQVRFIGGSPDQTLAQGSRLAANSPELVARGFLANYGQLFGLQDAGRDLAVMADRTLDDGRSFVRFQQQHEGVPVVGGELVVQVDARGAVISANGEVLPDLKVGTTPQVSIGAAEQTALAKVAKDYKVSVSDLQTTEPELWIYNPALLGGPGLRRDALVWRMEVTSVDDIPINVFILVDAQLGAVALDFNQIHAAKNRVIYDNNNNPALGLPGNGPVRSEGQGPTGTAEVDLAYDYSGDTYDFFMAEHGRDSLDGTGLTLISTVRYCPNALNCPFANAFWNGSQMVYGDGYASGDDVVGHELTHGVTNFTSNLFYYYQSGAINESFSDVWGEFIDQTNGAGTDTPGVKWLMGEDIPIGAIRNMANPPAFNDPDKMTSNLYFCSQFNLTDSFGDNGGVHINSGVNNKAAYLMTDGGSFNGQTVTPLGIPKVADLYYEVQTNLLVSGSDYADLYDALIQASINIGFSAAEQQEVKEALAAVEMNQDPTVCPANEAPICTSGTPTNLFFDDIESGGGNWTAGSNQGTAYWFVPQTSQTVDPSLSGPYATSGVGNIWGFSQGAAVGGTSDTYLAMNSDVSLPAGAYMHFNHAHGFETNNPSLTTYDGGVFEYSTNSGSFWQDAGPLFTHNGYNGSIVTGQGNPLAGRNAFVANSSGYISSRLDLSTLSGQNVRFRFRIGTDPSVFDYGWFVDDVRIYTCAAGPTNTPPTISGLPDQTLAINSIRNNAIDLWNHASDAEDADSALSFSVSNTTDTGAGVTIDTNRYVDINPASGWTGTATVTVQVQDTGALTDTDTFQVEVNASQYLYLPTIQKPAPPPPPPSGPKPGFWNSPNEEFYVTPDMAFVDEFAIFISVSGCGNYVITHFVPEPITNNQFSFTGPFSAAGTFNSTTTASGTDSLSSFFISGCGSVTGGPFNWSTAWQDGSQPTFLSAELVGSGLASPAAGQGKTTVLVQPVP